MFFIGQLVESWARGFGRVEEILPMGQLVIRFNRTSSDEIAICWTPEDALKCLLFYNKEETGYINPEADYRNNTGTI